MMLKTWNDISVICGNHTGEPAVEMGIYYDETGKMPLYVCRKSIMRVGDDKPCLCTNRISIKEMEELVQKINDLIIDPNSPYKANITGYHWTAKGIDYEIVSCDGSKIIVSALNKKAMSRIR